MAVTEQRHHAVVMGDLVGSTRAQSVEALHATFNAAVADCNRAWKDQLASPLTITLGDEFQGLATSLGAALLLVRNLRHMLMASAIDCRFAIGLVEIRTAVNADKAWNMMGPGLARTREKLNEKRAISLYCFAVTDDEALESALDALGAGLTAIERRWTDQQRQDIVALLEGSTPIDIARARNVTVHSVYKVRGSGDFDTYAIQWQAIAKLLAGIDAKNGIG